MKTPPPLPTDSRPWSRYVRSKRRPDWLPWAFGLLLVISVGVLGYVFGRMESGSPIVLERGQPGRAGMFADNGKDAFEPKRNVVLPGGRGAKGVPLAADVGPPKAVQPLALKDNDGNLELIADFVVGAVATDTDLLRVRQWLREHLASGEWEEVRWWPTITLTDRWKDELAALESEKASQLARKMDAEQLIAQFKAMKIQPSPRVSRKQPRPLPPVRINRAQLLRFEARYDYRDQLNIIEDVDEAIPRIGKRVAELKEEGPDRVCRIKIRSPNDFGALSLYDMLFFVRDDGVEVVSEQNDWRLARFGHLLFDNPGQTRLPKTSAESLMEGILDPDFLK